MSCNVCARGPWSRDDGSWRYRMWRLWSQSSAATSRAGISFSLVGGEARRGYGQGESVEEFGREEKKRR